MSLINRMLQDLDARRPELGPRSKLPNEVRPLPKARAALLPWLVLALLVAAGAAGYLLYRPDAGRTASAITSPIVARVEPETLSITPAPALQAVPQTPQPVQSEPPAAAPAASGGDDVFAGGSLRLAERIGVGSNKKVEARSATPAGASTRLAPTPTAAAAKVAGAETPAARSEVDERPAAPAPLAQGAARSPKPSSIEKTDAVGLPRDRAESEYRKAIGVVNQGRVSEAIDALRLALQHDKQHAAARQLLVKLLLEAGRSDEAVLALREGLEGQPAQLGWAMSLARLQLERGDLPAAWETLDASLPAAGRSADYQGFAAHVLQRLGRNREAAEYYLAATGLAPGEGRWWLGLGLAFDAEGRSTEAREAFQRAKASGTLNAELASLTDQKLR